MIPRAKPSVLLPLALLSGCAHPSINPIDWYHQLQGGAIAEDRPPPPNVNAPYPNLGTVPARPAPIDTAARTQMANGLVADRANAQYAAGLNPLPTPPGPGTRPVVPAARPADDNTSGATMPGAAGPPAKVGPLGPPQPALPNVAATPPRAAPTRPVQSAALVPPPGTTSPQRGSVDVPPPDGTPAAPVSSLPTVPNAPPPPPNFAGVPATTAPTPAPATPAPPPPPVVVAVPGAPILIAFPPNSATLPVESLGALKVLVQTRGGATVAVTGYGDAASSDANTQAGSLPLALARARAVASNLLAAGVPSASVRVSAEAQGHGAAARLVN